PPPPPLHRPADGSEPTAHLPFVAPEDRRLGAPEAVPQPDGEGVGRPLPQTFTAARRPQVFASGRHRESSRPLGRHRHHAPPPPGDATGDRIRGGRPSAELAVAFPHRSSVAGGGRSGGCASPNLSCARPAPLGLASVRAS